jgi:hypothetical protein
VKVQSSSANLVPKWNKVVKVLSETSESWFLLLWPQRGHEVSEANGRPRPAIAGRWKPKASILPNAFKMPLVNIESGEIPKESSRILN